MEDIHEIVLKLDKINCRICLKYCRLVNSLQDLAMCEEHIMLKDLLKEVTGLELTLHENEIPNSICQECTNKLLNANDFIRTVQRAEQILVNALYTENNETSEKKTGFEDSPPKIEHVDWNVTTTIETELSEVAEADLNFVQSSVHKYDNDNNDKSSTDFFKDNCPCEDTTHHSESHSSDEHEHENEIDNNKLTVETLKKHSKEIGSRLNSYHTSGWFSCTACSRQFAKEATLKRHMNTVHTSMQAEKLSAQMASGKFLDCQYCPRQFVRKQSLRRHIARCHPEKPQIEPDEDDIFKSEKIPSGYKRCLCPHCGKSYSQASLTIHIRRHTGEAPYKCGQCDKAFPRRQDLTVHERQHTGERPHSCVICGKSFVTTNKLTRHLRIHTGERPYKCDQCDKAFAQSNDLKIHLRRHTGEKPYKCNVCGESFISGSILNAHRYKTQHKPKGEKVDPYAKFRLSTQCTTPESVLMDENDIKISHEVNTSGDNNF